MAPDPASNIRVFIRWHEQTVFAGEEIRCTITFKNVATAPREPRHPSKHISARPSAVGGRPPPTPHRSVLAPTSSASPSPRSHRPAQSLSGPLVAGRSRNQAGPAPAASRSPASGAEQSPVATGGHKHSRSVSVVSIGSAGTALTRDENAMAKSTKLGRPGHGHGRSASLHIVAGERGLGTTGPVSLRAVSSSALPPPLLVSERADRPPDDTLTVPNTPTILGPQGQDLSDFRFPTLESPAVIDSPVAESGMGKEGLPRNSAAGTDSEGAGAATRSKEWQIPIIHEHIAPAAKIISTSNLTGTPRSSGEFYSLSNHSSETLASEYVTQQPTRGQAARPLHLRRMSNLAPQQSRRAESLMMGYAQIQGSFTLDGSLVSLSPFEDVKRKAVVGGQGGGGVVGVETTKRDGGLLGGLGWSKFGSSLGEFLGGGELSTIKEMRGIANSKSVPLISSPQSVLFVDLRLGPGESKVFEYSFRLPRGLPPTHRGKAIRISYGLVIGTQSSTQKPGGAKEQQVRSVEVPFRVLSSVNSHGELLGHDLMSPHVVLRDQGHVRIPTPGQKAGGNKNASVSASTSAGTTEEDAGSAGDFAAYVESLLARAPQSAGLLSPTAAASSRRASSAFGETPSSAREAIDMAIMRSSVAAEGQQSPNRFEIARNGRRVAVVILARPAYRLGEAVTMAVDFAGAEIPSYAVHWALETTERINPGLAIRSEAGTQRVTRRVHVSASEATMYARRAVFSPTIPVTATPDFITSGISLEWKIRVEFVVPAPAAYGSPPPREADDRGQGREGLQRAAASEEEGHPSPPLLEPVGRDEKGGMILVAVENVLCESFDVEVPLRVYGAAGTGLERLDGDDALELGLAV